VCVRVRTRASTCPRVCECDGERKRSIEKEQDVKREERRDEGREGGRVGGWEGRGWSEGRRQGGDGKRKRVGDGDLNEARVEGGVEKCIVSMCRVMHREWSTCVKSEAYIVEH